MSSIALATASNLVSADVQQNGRQIRELMTEARRQGARVIHFPESALSGHAKSEILDWECFDWECARSQINQISDLARHLGLWVILGCCHRLTPPNLPHNSLYVISDKGEIVDRYDKRYCSHTEINGWYTPGVSRVIVEIDSFRFGLALCIEIQFQEVFMEYGSLGADCVLLSAYASDPMFRMLSQAHAALNNLWVSLATPAQCAESLPNAVHGPDGALEVLGSGHRRASLVRTTINRGDPGYAIALGKARPWRAQARKGDIYREKQVDDARSRDKRGF